MGRKFGCLALLLVIALLSAELWVFLEVCQRANDILGPLLVVILMSVAGVRLCMHHGRRLAMELMAGSPGRRMVGLIGAVLLALPGLVTGVIGLLLQIPVVQRLFARKAGVLAGALARNAMKQAMGGGLGGGLGGAGFAGKFPGMAMRPDQRTVYPGFKPTKTIDTTVEKDGPPG